MIAETLKIKEPRTDLVQLAERLHSTPDETAALDHRELYRNSTFPHVFFQHSSGGRQARMRGTGLAVWELVKLADDFSGNVGEAAAHLQIDQVLVEEAPSYARSNSSEITDARLASESFTFPHLDAALREVHVFEARDEIEQS